jgi:hypothetical protein
MLAARENGRDTLHTLLDAAAPCAEAESMKRLTLLPLLVGVAALAMAGCGKEPSTAPGSTANDTNSQTFTTMMDQEPALAEGGTYESPGQSDFSATSGGLAFTDGAFVDATFFDESFPYLRTPIPGSPSDLNNGN